MLIREVGKGDVENPDMIRVGDRYELFYSASWWDTDRTTRCRLRHTVGLCNRASAVSTARFGPVGVLVQDRGGNWWIAYHAGGPPAHVDPIDSMAVPSSTRVAATSHWPLDGTAGSSVGGRHARCPCACRSSSTIVARSPDDSPTRPARIGGTASHDRTPPAPACRNAPTTRTMVAGRGEIVGGATPRR